MEYVVQAFKVLKKLVHAEANARAQKTGFFVAFLTQIFVLRAAGRTVYNLMRYTLVYRESDVRRNIFSVHEVDEVVMSVKSVYSAFVYRCDETGLIKLRISSDTQLMNNIKIYQFYLCY